MLSAAFILLAVICLCHLMIGLFVLLKNRRDTTNRLFFVFVLSIIGWLLTNYFSNDSSLSQTVLLFLNKAVFVFPTITGYFVLEFALSFTRNSSKVATWLHVMAGLVFAGVAITGTTNLFVAGLTPLSNGVGLKFGSLVLLYFVYMVVYFGLMVGVFVYALRQATGAYRARLQYVVAGILASFTVAIITNLLLPLIFGNYTFVSYGPFATLFLVGAMSVAIVKHRLFDIRLVVARSVAYVLLLATLAVVYGASIFGVSEIFFPSGEFSSSQNLVYIVLALVLSATFQPLSRFFERITASIFYRDRYDSQEVISAFSKILVSELDLDRIMLKSLKALCENLKIQFGQIIVYNNDRVYRIEHIGPLPKRLMVAPELAKLNQPMLVAEELANGERKSLLDQHGIRVSMTLRTREAFVGYVLLGDKLSGDVYSRQDLELLEIIGKELAVAVQNAKAYAEIQEFNLTLQARVDHATNRLRVANRHLKELDRAKDEFISMASHQLRTPLTTIKGYLSMMLEGDAGKLTKPQKEFVEYAFGSSERMVNLISDLLNVSRLSAGRFLIQTKPTDMVAMIHDEVRQLMTHATAKGLKLIFEPPKAPLPPAQIDENKTRQVIMNFIDNAIYYTQNGEVRVTLQQTGDQVRLEVHDTGIGVPMDARRKLFSKFYRADNAQIVRPDGTGLGLYLAKRVVEDQGGTIIFNSVEGKGSTFGFELPFKPQPVSHEDHHHARSK